MAAIPPTLLMRYVNVFHVLVINLLTVLATFTSDKFTCSAAMLFAPPLVQGCGLNSGGRRWWWSHIPQVCESSSSTTTTLPRSSANAHAEPSQVEVEVNDDDDPRHATLTAMSC